MRLRRSLVLSSLLLAAFAVDAAAIAVPANFVVENAVPGATFTQPSAIAWLPGGRMLVLEKAGVLWSVTNGVKSSKSMIDLNKEV
ncbi:PQQ-dependent sugar dehydrogenase, partial [Klebsiella pneumoniae]|nr:PQQ-dependent sugar dehydrogenase [Klebsiella pneumoniae]